MSCYSTNASNDSDCTPRDFSVMDISPENICSPPPLPLPRRLNRLKQVEGSNRVDGLVTRREPPKGPSDPHKFYREVVNKLALHIARESNDGKNRDLSLRRRRFNYSDTATLNQGGREALNSHYEQWTTKPVTSTLATARLHVPVAGPPIRPMTGVAKIRTIVKYVMYDDQGNKDESKYIIKMSGATITLRDFKKAMPHYVKRARFFFSIGPNENIELDDDSAKLPIITSDDGEAIIVAEITSRL